MDPDDCAKMAGASARADEVGAHGGILARYENNAAGQLSIAMEKYSLRWRRRNLLKAQELLFARGTSTGEFSSRVPERLICGEKTGREKLFGSCRLLIRGRNQCLYNGRLLYRPAS